MITLSIRDPERFRERMWELGALPATSFHWPVRLNIDGADIFDTQADPHHITVFDLGEFVRWGLATIEAAKVRGKCALELLDFPGALYMEMLDDKHVLVYCTLEGTTAVADYDELHRAWLEIADWFRQNAPSFTPDADASRWAEGWYRWFQGHVTEEPEECDYEFSEEDEQFIREARERWRKARGHGS